VILNPDGIVKTRGRCYDKKIFSQKIIAKKLAYLTQNSAKLCRNLSQQNWQKL
jgi:hypothetical protein